MLEPEEERPTLWAIDPERIDPDDFPPGSPYAREMTWAPCPSCGVDVHASVLHVAYHGLACPRCASVLLPQPEEPEEWVRRVLREEDEFAEQL
jgi:hypothetical protein